MIRSIKAQMTRKKSEPKEVTVPEPEKSQKKKPLLLHLAGVTYGKVRKPFVALDRLIQEAARK